MYDSIADFLQTLSANSRLLWSLLVLGVIVVLSLGLYAFWETVFILIRGARDRKTRSRGDQI